MKIQILLLFLICCLCGQQALAQDATTEDKPLGPTETVREFYQLLRNKRYLEGFKLSVYREAIESLSADELRELGPDFDRTFSNIPTDLKILGSQTNGILSTVFIKATDDPKDVTAEEVSLIKVNDRWVVGDQETLALVQQLGKKFFFEIRIRVNEENAQLLMEKYVGAEKLYFDANKGQYGNQDELVKANFWPPSLKSGEAYGYKFSIELGRDRRDFWLHAEPTDYNKSGRVSFYGDLRGVRRFDNKGKVYKFQLENEPIK